MKITIVGSRGIPAAYGGFETFAEELSVRLSEKGFDVCVVCQQGESDESYFKNVKLQYSRFSKEKNPVRFYFDSLKIAVKNSDVVLICGVGGAFFYPFVKRKNVKLVTHVDGMESRRGKFSASKKIYVRLAQKFAAAFSDHLIADSFAIRKYWIQKYKLDERKISSIEYGAIANLNPDVSLLKEFGIEPEKYFLVVCRIVPENNLSMIIKGYLKSGSLMKLVIVGDYNSRYGRTINQYASAKIIFTGNIYDKQKLFGMRQNCIAYLHGHSVGGTNPSLVEAMAAGNICICHDNEYNRETTNNAMLYFRNEQELGERINFTTGLSGEMKKKYSLAAEERINIRYNWDRITAEYEKLFQDVFAR